MYIVVIAWLFVILMMAITADNITAGVLTLFFYGLAPCALLLWLVGTPRRRRTQRKAAAASMASEEMKAPDRSDAQPDQRNL
jgi:hypothetical protein